jgi:hypothetical protein
MSELQFIGMTFESFVIIIALILLVLVYLKYNQKKHRLTLYLLTIFLFYALAIIFSWLSKVLILYSGINYIGDRALPDPGTPLSWILYRIIDFRISFVFMTIAIYLSYVLKVNVFEKGYNKVNRILVYVYMVATLIFTLFGYISEEFILEKFLLDVIAFLLIFIFMAAIYFPFLYRAIQSYKSAEKVFKNAFLSLALMSLFFIMIPLNFLFDRILILMGEPGFSIFYFLAWIFAILGILGAYFGYIRPRST